MRYIFGSPLESVNTREKYMPEFVKITALCNWRLPVSRTSAPPPLATRRDAEELSSDWSARFGSTESSWRGPAATSPSAPTLARIWPH